MRKLYPEHLLKPDSNALVSILGNYGLKFVSFLIPKKGIENTTVVVKTDKGNFVLRVYRRDKKKEREIRQEIEFMRYLKKHGIPVPRIIPNLGGQVTSKYHTSGYDWDCILMEFIQGDHPRVYSAKLIKELATCQAHMHNLGIALTKEWKYRSKILRILEEKEFGPHIESKKIKGLGVKAFLARAKRAKVVLGDKLPKGFNHLDYVRANTLIRGDRLVAVLDFDDIAFCPMAVCLGYTLWSVWRATGSIRKVREYIRQYSRTRILSKGEIQSLKDIILFRNYAMGAMEILLYGERSRYVSRVLDLEKRIAETSYALFAAAV